VSRCYVVSGNWRLETRDWRLISNLQSLISNLHLPFSRQLRSDIRSHKASGSHHPRFAVTITAYGDNVRLLVSIIAVCLFLVSYAALCQMQQGMSTNICNALCL
jgi:hypothetical protein